MRTSADDRREHIRWRVEEALHRLAVELRRVPVGEATRRLHVRALELKRDVTRWGEQRADGETMRAALEEIDGLLAEAIGWREHGAREHFV